MAEKRMRRRRPQFNIREAVHHWLTCDDAEKRFAEERGKHREVILEVLAAEGEENQQGHRFIWWPEDPVDGRIKGIKREKRVSKVLNPERAEKILKDLGLWRQCIVKVIEIDEAAILGFAYDTPAVPAKISADKLKEMYDISETYAFVPQRIKA